MAKFMKLLNNISRSQAVFRREKISPNELLPSQHAYALAICREPGRTQEEIASELCINKSTAARSLNALEEKGYIERLPLAQDKRCFSVYPTEKLLSLLPKIRAASKEWMELLSAGIPEDELEIFNSVLEKMEARAKAAIEKQDNAGIMGDMLAK